MLIEVKPNEQAQARIEEIATALQVHLASKTGELYELLDLTVAVEEWLESSLNELLDDGEEHLCTAAAPYAVGRRHLQDALKKLPSRPLQPSPAAPELAIAV